MVNSNRQIGLLAYGKYLNLRKTLCRHFFGPTLNYNAHCHMFFPAYGKSLSLEQKKRTQAITAPSSGELARAAVMHAPAFLRLHRR
jgi:hypothetical protein